MITVAPPLSAGLIIMFLSCESSRSATLSSLEMLFASLSLMKVLLSLV